MIKAQPERPSVVFPSNRLDEALYAIDGIYDLFCMIDGDTLDMLNPTNFAYLLGGVIRELKGARDDMQNAHYALGLLASPDRQPKVAIRSKAA